MKTIQYKHKKCIYNTYKPRKSIYEVKIFKAKIGLCIEVKICNTRQGMHPNKCQVTQLQSQPQPYKKTLIEQPKPKTLRSPSSMIYQVGREAIFERERERETVVGVLASENYVWFSRNVRRKKKWNLFICLIVLSNVMAAQNLIVHSRVKCKRFCSKRGSTTGPKIYHFI